MNWLRNGLIGAILLVVFLLFIRWNEFQEAQTAARAPSQETTIASRPDVPAVTSRPEMQTAAADDIPTAPNASATTATPAAIDTSNTQLIEVQTDTLHVLIDPVGGDIVKVSLPQYLAKLDDERSEFVLLNRSTSHTYIAESDLIGPDGLHTRESGRPVFNANDTRFVLNADTDELNVDLTLERNNVQITKRFSFLRGSYLVDIDYLINNQSRESFKVAMYGRIKRDDWVPPTDAGFGMQPYLGAAITTQETNYKKIDFDDLDDGPFTVEQEGGWVAMIQHYFVSAWIPDAETTNNFELRRSSDRQHYFLGFTGPLYSVAPGTQQTLSAQFYAGPKIIRTLADIAPHLDLTIDFSWLWFIAKPLFLALDFIHGFVANWGVAIILLTCLVKLIFFYPSALSYRSMAKMRKVMPLMQELKERYGDDRQRMGMETMKLYKKEGVNPVGGCLPMLMQMPVFIALYWVLMESVELRHSPFVLWIEDLSVKDPYFVLPLIFGATMFFQQKLYPPAADPMQAKIMQLMPIFFTFLFMMFPAGLVLYWVTNNALSIAQQYVITKQIENEGK